MAVNLNKGNPNIPFKRDKDGKIIYGQKHKAYVKDILHPKITFVEGEGAVRAGKDVYGLAAYALVLDLHPNAYHCALATTIGMAQMLILDADGFGIMHHFPDGYLGQVKDKTAFIFKDSQGRQKFLIVAGGDKENSYKGIRGLNYGSIYANEANLLHINSINEAKNRIQASHWPKFIFTQNPDAPNSTFYELFEKNLMEVGNKKYKNDNPNNVWNGPDFRYHHFLQYDNPILTPERIEKNLRTFASEVDRQRNFYGVRIAAEGAIFDMLSSANYYEDGDGTLTEYQKFTFSRYILVDCGTVNPQVYIDCFINPKTFDMYLDREYRWDSRKMGSQKTDSQNADDIIEFIKNQRNGGYGWIIVDPAASGFKVECTVRGLIIKDADNTVMGRKGKADISDNKESVDAGIKLVQIGFMQNKIHINKEHCGDGISECKSYRWDMKARERGVEQPLKSADHFPDALRYGVNTLVKYAFRWGVGDQY